MKKTLVIGASENSNRYSNKAIHKLLANDIEVVALGRKQGVVEGVVIENEMKSFENIHTITMYVGPKNQDIYFDYIISLNPKRVIFNPGTENPILENMLLKNHIFSERACTLVMLSLGSY